MDNLSDRLKAKKPKAEEEDPNKKDRIMKMHAEGEEINFARCDDCGMRIPAKDLQEHEGSYYCADCIAKIKSFWLSSPY